MSMADYPDFVRVEQWVGSPLSRGVQAGVVNGQVFGPFFCAPWEAVAFDVSQSGAADVWIVVNIDYLDAPAGNVIATNTYVCGAGQRITDVVPVQSLYCRFTIGLQASPRNLNLTIVPRRGFDPSTRMHNGTPLLRAIGLACAASPASVSIATGPIMAAHCTLTVDATAVAWSAQLVETDVVGTGVSHIASLGTSVGMGQGTITVDLPPGPCLLVMRNGDAVGRTFSAALIPQRI